MRFHAAHSVFGLACLGFLALAASAHAQPVEIVYAGQGAASGGSSSHAQRLSGGAENSYGYGSTVERRRGAVIDIRRPSNGPVRAEPIAYQEDAQQDNEEGASRAERPAAAPQAPARGPAAPGGQGREPWLERERVGPPYQANGQWYVPTPEPGYEQTGTASWYGPTFNGQRTASGEVFDQTALTAAHPTLPIPSLVQVTNLENGREVIVRVNDRGPFVGNRLIDVSQGAAQVLGIEHNGTARVHVRYLGPAPRHVDAAGADVASPAPAPVNAPQLSPERAPELVPEPAQAVSQQAAQEGPASLLPPPSAEPVRQAPLPSVQRAFVPAPVSNGYFVQVGAFAELENAHRVRAALLGAGPVLVDTRQTANGELFRVRVGPYASREEADAARQTVTQMGYSGAIIAAP